MRCKYTVVFFRTDKDHTCEYVDAVGRWYEELPEHPVLFDTFDLAYDYVRLLRGKYNYGDDIGDFAVAILPEDK